MTDFKELIQRRRSHRAFTGAPLSSEDLGLILRAALYAPTACNRQSWHFTVVDDPSTLEKLSECKAHGASFVKDCAAAVVVSADPETDGCWVEDCSIAAICMQLQAEDLGLGSCWVQVRGYAVDGVPSSEVIRGLVGLPEGHEAVCVLALGHYADEKAGRAEEDLKWENVTVCGDDKL